jgi:hypothetical protein
MSLHIWSLFQSVLKVTKRTSLLSDHRVRFTSLQFSLTDKVYYFRKIFLNFIVADFEGIAACVNETIAETVLISGGDPVWDADTNLIFCTCARVQKPEDTKINAI